MKKASLFGMLLVLSLVLAACGGTTGQETPAVDGNSNSGDLTSTEVMTPDAVVTEDGGSFMGTVTVDPGNTVDATPEAAGTSIPVTGADVNRDFRLSNMLTYNVVDSQGNDLGDINDFVIGVSGPSIEYVLVGAGGFLGIGEQNILVPFDQFTVRMDGDTREFVFNGTQDALVNGPAVDLSDLNFAADGWDADFVGYWNGVGDVNSNANDNGNLNGNTNGNDNADPGNTTDGNLNGNDNSDSGNLNSNNNVPDALATGVATPLPEDPNMVTNGNDNGEMGTTGEIASAFNYVLASELLDARVLDEGRFMGAGVSNGNDNLNGNANTNANSNDDADDDANSNMNGNLNDNANVNGNANSSTAGTFDAIGNVEEVLVDANTGMLSYIVVAGSEAIDRLDRWIPVPFSQVMIFADPDNTDMNNVHDVVVVVRSDLLQGAPDFDVDMLPDVSVQGWDTDLNTYWDAVP